jgi:hypothetical protein
LKHQKVEMTYRITFACYRPTPVDDQPAYRLDRRRREAVLTALLARCLEHSWGLLAAHVGTHRVDLVLETDASPQRAMNDLKAYANRHLNRLGFDDPGRKRWIRIGKTQSLWERENVQEAIREMVAAQGEARAVFVRDDGPEQIRE